MIPLLNSLLCDILFSNIFSSIKRIYYLMDCKFSDVLPACVSVNAIGNLWTICLRADVLSPFPYIDAGLASETIVE